MHKEKLIKSSVYIFFKLEPVEFEIIKKLNFINPEETIIETNVKKIKISTKAKVQSFSSSLETDNEVKSATSKIKEVNTENTS